MSDPMDAALLTTMACLAAAIAVKRGESKSAVLPFDPETGEMSPALTEAFQGAHETAFEMLRYEPPEVLDEAINLYRADLRARGYSFDIVEESGKPS